MRVYIRQKPEEQLVTFVSTTEELRRLIEDYIPGRKIIIGDLYTFSRMMLQLLLKFCEANPEVDVYSSCDLTNPVLLSRFPEIIKEPLEVVSGSPSVEEYKASRRDYLCVMQYLPHWKGDLRLRAPRLGLLTDLGELMA